MGGQGLGGEVAHVSRSRLQRTPHQRLCLLRIALGFWREARQVSQQIKTRLSKNSKYVNGINLLYHNDLA